MFSSHDLAMQKTFTATFWTFVLCEALFLIRPIHLCNSIHHYSTTCMLQTSAQSHKLAYWSNRAWCNAVQNTSYAAATVAIVPRVCSLTAECHFVLRQTYLVSTFRDGLSRPGHLLGHRYSARWLKGNL